MSPCSADSSYLREQGAAQRGSHKDGPAAAPAALRGPLCASLQEMMEMGPSGLSQRFEMGRFSPPEALSPQNRNVRTCCCVETSSFSLGVDFSFLFNKQDDYTSYSSVLFQHMLKSLSTGRINISHSVFAHNMNQNNPWRIIPYFVTYICTI